MNIEQLEQALKIDKPKYAGPKKPLVIKDYQNNCWSCLKKKKYSITNLVVRENEIYGYFICLDCYENHYEELPL